MVQDHEGIPIKGYRGLRPPGDLIYGTVLRPFCVETLDLYVSSINWSLIPLLLIPGLTVEVLIKVGFRVGRRGAWGDRTPGRVTLGDG